MAVPSKIWAMTGRKLDGLDLGQPVAETVKFEELKPEPPFLSAVTCSAYRGINYVQVSFNKYLQYSKNYFSTSIYL